MKLTKKQIKQIIKEELSHVIQEQGHPATMEEQLEALKYECESRRNQQACEEFRQLEDYMFGQGRLMNESKEEMTDEDVGGLLFFLSDDFNMGLHLLQSFKHKNLSPNSEDAVAQALWHKTTGFWNDPKWIALRTALRNAQSTGLYHKIAPAEKALDDFNANAQNNIDEFAHSLDMTGRELWDHIDGNYIDTLQKFQNFLKQKGVL